MATSGSITIRRVLGLFVAAGDSGHGFKFAPILGALIADVVEGRPNRGRHDSDGGSACSDSKEAARALDATSISRASVLPGCAFVGAAVPHQNARHEHLLDPDGQRRGC